MNQPIIQLSNYPINAKSPNGKIFDIHERIYRWVVNVIKFSNKIPKNQQNLIIIGQITESVTSVGANDQEADASNSKKDFIAKYVIARKECKETIYWLRLINDTNSDQFVLKAKQLITEGREISHIISSIIINANK